MPAGGLAKARLTTMVIACLSLAGQAAQVGNHAHGRAWHLMSLGAIVALIGIVAITYRRQRVLPGEPVLVPVLAVLGGSGLLDAVVTTGLSIAVMLTQSLYGSRTSYLIRSAGCVLAVPVAVALSPYAVDRYVSWHSPTVLGVIPQLLLMAAITRVMHTALVRQEEANARESVLARTGSELLGVTDVLQARQIGRSAIASLAVLAPGTVFAVLSVSGGTATVTANAGFAGDPAGTELPVDVLALITADRDAGAHLGPLHQLAPGVWNWRGTPLVTRESDRYLLAGGPQRVADGVFDAFLSLSHQVSLAEASCLTHAELNHQANHDYLTTLPTRSLFFRQLATAIDGGGAHTVALLNIDLDDFKQVNDVYGHAAGDELLIEVARRLAEAGGPGTIAARFGGDEFALLVTGLDDPAEAVRLAERVCQRIIEPLRLSSATVSVGASIGVAVAEPVLTAGDLLRCADIAMYSAKARGKNRVERFTAAEHGGIAHHRMLEEHLSRAAERGEIVVRYQPLVDLRTGECTSVEALSYWQHPSLGLLGPAEFLPLAERTGQILELGTHMLREACRQLAGWSQLPGAASLRIGVNVSARQVLDVGFAATVASALAESGLAPDKLVLELVESEHMDDTAAREQLRRVAASGVRIALDDFGTGYVSLASLRSFPIHQIKIDPAFLDSGDPGAMQLVISVGEVLGTETVVQGLADPADAERLRATSVTYGQGPLVADPMSAGAFAPWLSQHLTRR